MLALDSTIGCIEVSESDVVDLYRSAPITRSSQNRTDTMEAYLCAVRRKALVKVYLALVVNDYSIFVYSTPGKGKSEQEYPREIEAGLSCARTMGFSPERVDLSYSPAMREVVVRNTKVLRLPGTKGTQGLKHGLAGAPVLPVLDKPPASPPPGEGEGGGTGHPIPPPHLPPPGGGAKAPEPTVAAPSPLAVPAPLPVTAATGAPGSEGICGDGGDLLAALAQLQHEQRTLAAERETLTRQLQQLSAQHHESLDQLVAARQTNEELAGERDALRAQQRQGDELVAAKENVIAQLQQQVADLGLELEALKKQNAEISRTHDAMLENLAQARQDIAGLCAERDAALADAGSVTQKHRESVTQLEEARRELEKTQGEGALARPRTEALEESARSREQELVALQQELAAVTSQRDAALQRLAADNGKESGDSDREGLRQELERAPTVAAESARPGEESFPARVLPGLQDAGPDPLPACVESTPPPCSELQVPPQVGHPWDAAADAAEAAEPASGAAFSFSGPDSSFVPLGDLQDGFFPASNQGEPIRFLLETGLDAIDCATAESVLELHHSINNAYLSPEGTGGQESCQGYICCLRKGESKEVYAAIYGTQSHRTRVYLPETQPRDEESYARTVGGAIGFAEEVGLMMERVPLEAAVTKRLERLKRCPVLRLAQAK